MKTINKPMILNDKSRLQEIYHLRVLAYEHSPKKVYVNKKDFPDGWFDDLDELDETHHWIIEDNHQIIASARLAIINDLKKTHESFLKFELPNNQPFAYWSRLVVHPDYRKTNAMIQLDNARKQFLIENTHIRFAVSVVSKDRSASMLRLGFEFLGEEIYDWGNGINPVYQFFYLLNQPAN